MTQPESPAEGKRKKQRKEKPLLEQPPVSAPEQDGSGRNKFARVLGSTDYQTREKGLQALSRWLVHKHNMTDMDMLKIWKGLFYCFWHSDKAPVQVGGPAAACALHGARCDAGHAH